MIPLQKTQFRVLIERDEDGYFVASVPALPGCHTQGKTYAELMKNVRDAIQLSLEVIETNSAYRRRVAEFAYEPSFVGMERITI